MNRAERMDTRGHAISGVFVFLLLGLFALLSVFMVLMGAQLYRSTVNQTAQHNTQRIMCSYLMNTVRGNDAADTVSTRQLDDIGLLVFGWDVDGKRYETKIYCYDGTLRELFGSAEQEFRPDYGEVICEAQAFTPTVSDGVLTMRITAADGQTEVLHAALRCGAAEGAQS